MRIAILGTRGIPNRHGGFDRAAEEISTRLADMGHEVTVYNTDDHHFTGDAWFGVRIRRIFSHEKHLGIFGTFLFDFLSLLDAVGRDFDIIFEMGHYPAALFFPLVRKSRALLITNIDGLCWKRPKWSWPLRRFILYCEQRAVHRSHALIADHPAIQSYCLYRYAKHSHYIAYGATIPSDDNNTQLELLGLKLQAYYMLVARLEPENNIDMILAGYQESGSELPFVVVGGLSTRHARYIQKKYAGNHNIHFVGGIYNYEALSGLRKNCKMYFHGHSVGGTTPSLLEAMACEAYIAAHDNEFNRGILGDDGVYFSRPDDIAHLIRLAPQRVLESKANNLNKIRNLYDWGHIATQHERLFYKLLRNHADSGEHGAPIDKMGQE